jgi:hypothetical protein
VAARPIARAIAQPAPAPQPVSPPHPAPAPQRAPATHPVSPPHPVLAPQPAPATQVAPLEPAATLATVVATPLPATPPRLQRLTSRPQAGSPPAQVRPATSPAPRQTTQLAVARETLPFDPFDSVPDAPAFESPHLQPEPPPVAPQPTLSAAPPLIEPNPGAVDIDELFDALLERLRRELLLERERTGSMFGL